MEGSTKAAIIQNQSMCISSHRLLCFFMTHFSSNASQHSLILLIIYTYIGVGLENRPKDLGRLYFWMTVRDKDLNFLVASLSEADSASEGSESPVLVEGNVPLSAYAKRKRLTEEVASKQKLSDKREQMYLFKKIMSPSDNPGKTDSSNDVVAESVVKKNLSAADKNTATANHTQVMMNSDRVNNLLKVMDNTFYRTAVGNRLPNEANQ